ncbi:hypothetical protein GW17_00046748 [Ensete ventricosum]|nr:hypothetical protein GW17_00046748 [Ensete ventricosum]
MSRRLCCCPVTQLKMMTEEERARRRSQTSNGIVRFAAFGRQFQDSGDWTCESMEFHGKSCGGEEEVDLRRGPWTVDEDLVLVNYIAVHGEGRWNSLARCAELERAAGSDGLTTFGPTSGAATSLRRSSSSSWSSTAFGETGKPSPR